MRLLKNPNSRYSILIGGIGLIENKNDGNALEIALGLNRQVSKDATVNLDVKKEFGDYDGWNVQGMVNVKF